MHNFRRWLKILHILAAPLGSQRCCDYDENRNSKVCILLNIIHDSSTCSVHTHAGSCVCVNHSYVPHVGEMSAPPERAVVTGQLLEPGPAPEEAPRSAPHYNSGGAEGRTPQSEAGRERRLNSPEM